MTPRILVVDDEPAIRELIVDFLSDEGYDVESAIDGQDAVGKLSTERYDVLIVDVMMPKLDGYEVVKAVREIPGAEETPVILMSALDSLNGRADGVTTFLHKPFDIDRLLETLEHYFPSSSNT